MQLSKLLTFRIESLPEVILGSVEDVIVQKSFKRPLGWVSPRDVRLEKQPLWKKRYNIKGRIRNGPKSIPAY